MKNIKRMFTLLIICMLMVLSFTACSQPGVGTETDPAATEQEAVIDDQTDEEVTDDADSDDQTSDADNEQNSDADDSQSSGSDTTQSSDSGSKKTSDSGSKKSSGSSTKKKSDTSKKTTETEPSSGDSSADTSQGDGLITESEAIAIVLKRVKGATADNIVSFEKDYDDGRWQYEGELVYDGIEYEFEIDAQNGNILDWEIDD